MRKAGIDRSFSWPASSLTMRKAASCIFLMASSLALAMAAAALLLPPATAATPPPARSLGMRSRFLAAAALARCSDESRPCPEVMDRYGYSNPFVFCCNGVCVDTSFNAQHCGGCSSCGSWPWICCDGYCFNSQNDFENCGRCGNFCDGNCNHGVCDYAA